MVLIKHTIRINAHIKFIHLNLRKSVYAIESFKRKNAQHTLLYI